MQASDAMHFLALQIWENWYLRTDIYPQAAPIIAQLPLGYAQGFTIAIQVHKLLDLSIQSLYF